MIIRVIDFETTGLPENEASAICEVGCCDVVREIADGPWHVGKTWSALCNPGAPIPGGLINDCKAGAEAIEALSSAMRRVRQTGRDKREDDLRREGYARAVSDLANKGDYEMKDWSEPYRFLKDEGITAAFPSRGATIPVPAHEEGETTNCPKCHRGSVTLAKFGHSDVCLTPPPAVEGETGWVIERGDSPMFEPLYWGGEHGWTKDNLQAVRFCRQIDAHSACGPLHPVDGGFRVQEHGWG